MFLTDNNISWFTKYTVLFLILFGVCYMPIEGRGGFGMIKLGCMISAVILLIIRLPFPTKALLIGSIYIIYQFFIASLHPESFRWSTILFSCGFVFSYVCIYNLIYVKQVFTIQYFIKFCERMIWAFFIVCLIQQFCISIGLRYFPPVNLIQILNRGMGCNSLSMEPSTFARTMLVFYYVYVKCCEYVRDKGPFTIKELFNKDHRWITIPWIWMMCTMGSGTAYVCLIAFSLYFVTKKNWYFIIPSFIVIYFFVLPLFHAEQLNRATRTINATSTLSQEAVEEADGSAGSRISPILNSLTADYTNSSTWFGHGIDYSRNNNLVVTQKATLFDDYGFIFYIISLIFNLTCAYRLKSLGALYMFMGIAGGAGTNIHYCWWLMMIMTCQRYFYENRYNPEIYEFDENETQEKEETYNEPLYKLT